MTDSKQQRYKDLYRAGVTPWDVGRPDFNLIDTVTGRKIPAGPALDIGCGSGANSIWLAGQGFAVTGVDVSEIALSTAGENAAKAGVACAFLLIDFFIEDVPGAPFGFVFDRGCFHSFDTDDVRRQFAGRVEEHLDAEGLWLSIIGSADEPPRGPGPLAGPPRRTAQDIAAAVEGSFEIVSLVASQFESNAPRPPRAWVCLMKKRGNRVIVQGSL